MFKITGIDFNNCADGLETWFKRQYLSDIFLLDFKNFPGLPYWVKTLVMDNTPIVENSGMVYGLGSCNIQLDIAGKRWIYRSLVSHQKHPSSFFVCQVTYDGDWTKARTGI